MSSSDIQVEHRGIFDIDVSADMGQLLTVRSIIRNSGAAEKLRRWEAADRKAAGKRGGPGPFANYEQMLIIWCLVARSHVALTMNAATALVCYGMDKRTQAELGLKLDGRTPERVCWRLRRSYKRLLSILDPYPCPRKALMTQEEFRAHEALADLQARAIRLERIRELTNALVLATIPKWVREQFKGNVVQDATLVRAYGKQATKDGSKYMASEPYAGRYTRHGDHSYSETTGKSKPEVKGHGWELHLSLLGSNDPYRQRTFPLLAAGVSFATPGAAPGISAIHALKPMINDGFAANLLVGDRAYGNTPKAADFQIPARKMGFQLLFDIHPQYWGRTLIFDGVVMLEGNVYSPAILGMPKLISASVDRYRRKGEDPERIDDRTYQKRLEQRARYLVQFRTGPDQNGNRQGRCPATGPNPTLACPLREFADNLGIEEGKTLLSVTKSKVPAVGSRGGLCTNPGASMVLRGEHWDKHAMAGGYQFGTPKWHMNYNIPRQSIESYNRLLKDGSGAALDSPDRRRIRGYAAAFIFATLLVMRTNLKQLGRWTAPKIDSRGRSPLRETKKRRRELTNGHERVHPRDKFTGKSPPKSSEPAPRVIVGI